MSASVAKIVGTPTKSAWAQIHTFVPDILVQQKTHGQLVVVISLSEDFPETEIVDVGREIIQRLQEEYFGRDTGSPLERLKSSIETVAQTFSTGAKLEIVAAVIFPQHIYFSVWGGGKVLIWRGGKLVSILSAREGLSGTSSGEWKAEDIFVIGTQAFFDAIPNSTLSSLFSQGLVLQDAADEISSVVLQTPNPNLAGTLFKIYQDEIEKIEGETIREEVNENEISEESPIVEPEVESIQSYETISSEPTTIRFSQRPSLQSWLVKLAEKLPEQALTVKTPSQSSRRTAISVGIVLLVLLGASILFGAQQKKTHDYKIAYQDKLLSAQNAYNDAILQKDINPPHSRELFQQAKDTVDSLVAQGIKDEAIDTLKQKLDQDSGSILGKVTTAAQLFIDLSLVRSGVEARELLPLKDELAVLDIQGQRIITVGTDTKETSAIGGADKLTGAKTFTFGDAYYVLTDSGIVKETAKGEAKVEIKTDDEWGEIAKLGFFGSNLYLLDKDPSTGQVWRYSAGANGFGDKKAWLQEETEVNFSNAMDFAIDGSLWIITTEGKIYKFNRGLQDNFSISGIDTLSPTAFYTDENLDSLYILDATNKRIVQIAKNGEYKKQYQTEAIGQAVDLTVSKETGKIYLLTPDKIFTLDLQ